MSGEECPQVAGGGDLRQVAVVSLGWSFPNRDGQLLNGLHHLGALPPAAFLCFLNSCCTDRFRTTHNVLPPKQNPLLLFFILRFFSREADSNRGAGKVSRPKGSVVNEKTDGGHPTWGRSPDNVGLTPGIDI